VIIDPEATQEANRIFAQECRFVLGAAKESDLPLTTLPEFAFAGRSNVGKSSLINAVLNRKTLVKTSKTPGRTQQINFFELAEKIMLVDLPGYGYARVQKTKILDWNYLINDYLRGRVQLKRVFFLVDSRHGLKPIDLKTMQMLDEAAVSYQIVLTKIDKIKKPEREQVLADTMDKIKKRPAAFPQVILTSSDKKWGLEELRLSIMNLVS
jgi:GTP-binding protein